MSRTLRMLLVVLFVGSCAVSSGGTPRNLDNACSIVNQKPQYLRAFKRTERRWGVPVSVQMAVIHQESKFKPRARPPVRYALGIIPRGRASSAYGYAQALDGTWDDYKKRSGRFGARRSNIRDASDFIGWYMTGAKRRAGMPLNDARNQYLAYHEGVGGYMKGSYRSKGWLMSVANKVDARAAMYNRQLRRCGKI